MHLASCRRLFQKHASGDDRGKYVRLDFTDLLALDALDDELRKAFLTSRALASSGAGAATAPEHSSPRRRAAMPAARSAFAACVSLS